MYEVFFHLQLSSFQLTLAGGQPGCDKILPL
jgi:hypothetical protein